MDTHSIANIFPLMQGEDFARLVEDVRKNGLVQPVIIYEGKILDGRNRFRACQEAGVPVRTEAYEGPDPLGFVISANIQRRHLTTSQRAMAAARMATLKVGDNQHTGGCANLRTLSQDQAAELLNVSRRLVQDARAVLDSGREDLIEGVDAGAMKVSTAANKLKEREKAPKVDEAVRMAAALDVVEGGLSEAQAKDKYGITKHAVREAVIAERARRENAPLDPTSFDPPTRQQFEALLEKEKRRLEAEFARRVQEAIDKRIDEEIWPIYQERASESTLLVKRRKGQMTKEEYSLVLRCLHPDQSASKETLTRAFQIFRKLELIFLDETQRPTPGVPTLDEAMKMAMERRAAKQAAKQEAKKKKRAAAA